MSILRKATAISYWNIALGAGLTYSENKARLSVSLHFSKETFVQEDFCCKLKTVMPVWINQYCNPIENQKNNYLSKLFTGKSLLWPKSPWTTDPWKNMATPCLSGWDETTENLPARLVKGGLALKYWEWGVKSENTISLTSFHRLFEFMKNNLKYFCHIDNTASTV